MWRGGPQRRAHHQRRRQPGQTIQHGDGGDVRVALVPRRREIAQNPQEIHRPALGQSVHASQIEMVVRIDMRTKQVGLVNQGSRLRRGGIFRPRPIGGTSETAQRYGRRGAQNRSAGLMKKLATRDDVSRLMGLVRKHSPFSAEDVVVGYTQFAAHRASRSAKRRLYREKRAATTAGILDDPHPCGAATDDQPGR